LSNDLTSLSGEIEKTLRNLMVEYKKLVLGEFYVAFKVEMFGTVVVAINRKDYGYVKSKIAESFPGLRATYIAHQERYIDNRDKIIWALMRGGYIRRVRSEFPRQFNRMIVMENFGNRIIKERLRVWNGDPKYKFLIDENEAAKKAPMTYVLSQDPGFFDYMPELKEGLE